MSTPCGQRIPRLNPTVTRRYSKRSSSSSRPGIQDLPRLPAFRRRHDAVLLQHVDQPRRARIADVQPPLKQRGGHARVLSRQLPGCLVQRVVLGRGGSRLLAILRYFFQQVIQLIRNEVAEPVARPPGDDRVQLPVGHERPLQPLRLGGVRRHEQHVPAAEQLLGARPCR